MSRDTDAPVIKAVLFDVFGTVVDWRSGVARAVEEAAAARGVALDPLAIADAWRARYQPSMEAVRSSARPWTILDVLHRESLDAVLAAFDLEAAFDAPARDALTRAWWRLDPWTDAVEGVRRLKARALVAPCSNGGLALMTTLSKRAGLPWDAIWGRSRRGPTSLIRRPISAPAPCSAARPGRR